MSTIQEYRDTIYNTGIHGYNIYTIQEYNIFAQNACEFEAS